MARRKRIPYDPPHARRGRSGRRQGPPRRAEQIFMTRRMFLAKGAIVGAFGTLAAKLGYMQVVKGEQYQQQAIQNQIAPQAIKATRGLIFDRRGKELARNNRTWEVRVLPADLAALDPAERRRVLDHLINALNLPDALVLNPADLPDYAVSTVYARTAQLLDKPSLAVEVTGQTVRPLLSTVPGQVLRVNGYDLHVFVYPDRPSREADAQRIPPDGSTIDDIPVSRELPAHVAGGGNVLTLLLSPDFNVANTVKRAVDTLQSVTTLDQVATVLRDFGLKAWTDYIENEKHHNYLINLEDDLTTDQAARCRAHLHDLPGVKVMNRLEYLVENGRQRSMIVVRRGVPREVALKLEANKLSLPGVELDDGVLVRSYPGGPAMSHILGYTAMVTERERAAAENLDTDREPLYDLDDVIGRDGLERTMERLLRGRRGSRIVELDALGMEWKVVPDSEQPAVAGKNLALTIDLEFQQAVAEILREGIRFANEDRRALGKVFEKDAGAGAVVAIDPRNGEVLAMVSYPHYDNQLFIDGISSRKFKEYVDKEAHEPLLDRALRGKYPPGSTLKIFLAAAALHERKIDPNTTFTCTGAIRVPRGNDETKSDPHPCWATFGHGTLDVLQAIGQSCDVFFYNAGTPGQKISDDKVLHYYDVTGYGTPNAQIGDAHDFRGLGIELIKKNLGEQFWFGKSTEIDLPTEDPAHDLWTRHEEGFWSAGDTINVAIGQGYFLTTPLQLALNTAALANGGTIYKPLLVREAFDDARQAIEPFEPRVLQRLSIAPERLATVTEGMRRVVHDREGTAFDLIGQTRWPMTNPPNEPEVQLAGKTGTAELGKQNAAGLYTRQHAWFTAFAPREEAEIAIAVIIEDGGEGSSYAVPVTDRVLRAYFEITGQRPRGLVLRQEGLGADGSVLAPSAAFPTPGAAGTPATGRQD